jgi:hypothetical protein
MFLPNASDTASLLVKEGTELTIDPDILTASGVVENILVRPRTTTALKILAGKAVTNPVGFSNERHFQRVESGGDLFPIESAFRGEDLGGVPPVVLNALIDALDDTLDTPSEYVEFWPEPEQEPGCACSREPHSRKKIIAQASSTPRASSGPDARKIRPVSIVPVPIFVRELMISALLWRIKDIVIESDATLTLGKNLHYLWGFNFLGYWNSRVVQRAKLMTVHMYGNMRGGVFDKIHKLDDDRLTIDWEQLGGGN